MFFVYFQKNFPKFLILGIIGLIFVSNIIFPYNYATIILPIKESFNDYSAPIIDIKNIPTELKEKMINNNVGTFYPAYFEWYVKKPDFVVPYSMSGRNIIVKEIDDYTGVTYVKEPPNREYYFVKDYFSYYKFHDKNEANKFFNECDLSFKNSTLEIFYCK